MVNLDALPPYVADRIAAIIAEYRPEAGTGLVTPSPKPTATTTKSPQPSVNVPEDDDNDEMEIAQSPPPPANSPSQSQQPSGRKRSKQQLKRRRRAAKKAHDDEMDVALSFPLPASSSSSEPQQADGFTLSNSERKRLQKADKKKAHATTADFLSDASSTDSAKDKGKGKKPKPSDDRNLRAAPKQTSVFDYGSQAQPSRQDGPKGKGKPSSSSPGNGKPDSPGLPTGTAGVTPTKPPTGPVPTPTTPVQSGAETTVNAPARPSHAPSSGNRRSNPCVVIFDNISRTPRKRLEPELCRVAPWLRPVAVEIMPSGGLRVKCKTPAEAERLINRDGFPADAFGGGKALSIHRPRFLDPSRPVSNRLERELRSIVTSRLPGCYTSGELITMMHPDYVEEISDIPPKDKTRAPLRIVVLKTKALRDEAIQTGLKWMNRRVRARPLRPRVLPTFCRRCSHYGHATIDCTRPRPLCGKCCSEEHTIDECEMRPGDPNACCPNCPEGTDRKHFATYRGCPAFRAAVQAEIALRKARAEKKEAKALAREQQHRPQRDATVREDRPFAAAAASAIPAAQEPAQPSAQQFISPDSERLYRLLLGALETQCKNMDAKLSGFENRLSSIQKEVSAIRDRDCLMDDDDAAYEEHENNNGQH